MLRLRARVRVRVRARVRLMNHLDSFGVGVWLGSGTVGNK